MIQEPGREADILIIGGGIIGICAAHYLIEGGRSVTVLERGEIGAGCSYGNAGLIVPSHLIPLAAPGVLAQGLKWMLDVEGPFYVKPRLDRELLNWLWRFRAACRDEPMRQAIPILRDLGFASADLYQELITTEALSCHYQHAGQLTVYRTRHGYEEALAEAKLLQEYGVALDILDGPEVRQKEPCISGNIIGGVYFRRDAHLDPALFVQALAGRIQQTGGILHPGTEVLGFETGGQRIVSVQTTRGDFRPKEVVLAAGSWSAGLARDLGLKLPIQPAKGYSVTYKRPQASPRLPLMLGEARVAVTPLGPLLRLAGTLELAGFDLAINQRRVKAIQRAAGDYLDLSVETLELVELWRGLRPCTPDGLPIIGRPASWRNLILAAGHAMIGVSLAPVTGKLVAQLANGGQPMMDLRPLRPERFA